MRTSILTACLVVLYLGACPVRGEDTPQGYTITAEQCRTAPRIDGRLSQGEWDAAAVVTGFTQMDPDYGALSRYPVYVFVMYDSEFLYVAADLRDSLGVQPRVAELTRDFIFAQTDAFGFVLDPLHDRRNTVGFFTNPAGAQLDVQSFDERLIDSDWNTVWQVRAAITDSGWACEFAVPWKSLRYPAEATTMGINFERLHRRFNEWSVWSPHSRGYSVFRSDEAGELSALHLPVASRNLSIVPYSLAASGEGRSDLQAGGDVKWAPDPWTTLEFTANTDFAQTDLDRAVINLDRFSVLFPERRQFFLENSGTFLVAGNSTLLQPFFSRRIGLDLAGHPEHLDAGLRMLRRGTETSVGFLGVRTRSRDSSLTSHHLVARASQNVGAQSRIGGLVTFRHDNTERRRQRNLVAAIDGFVRSGRHFRFEYMVTGSVDKSDQNRKSQSGGAALLSAVYRTDDFNLYAGETVISEDYSAQTGFVAWPDVGVTEMGIDYFCRPGWRPNWLQELAPAFYINTYHRASDGKLLEAQLTLWPVYMIFRSGAVFYVLWWPTWQNLESGFTPVDDVTIAPGEYFYNRILAKLSTDHSAPIGGRVYLEGGSFYDGTLTSLRPRVYLRPSAHLSVATAAEWNRFTSVGRAAASAGAALYSIEAQLAVNPRLQVASFYEYNTGDDSEALQFRLNWEFRPLSHVYLVLSTTDEVRTTNVHETETRGVVKVLYQYQL